MQLFSDLNTLAEQIVLIREDFNVPLKEGRITDDTRIEAALPTIQAALSLGAGVILVSHLGRPEAGHFDEAFSLAPVAHALGERLGQPVPLIRDWQHTHPKPEAGEVLLLENIRFEPGELDNDELLGQQLASLCDYFVMDAFATAHRAHASTHAVALRAPMAYAGPLLEKELEALKRSLTTPATPVVGIVGGAKVSSKLTILETLLEKVDTLILGGGIVNTFLKAQGIDVQDSLYEPDLVETAQALLERYPNKIPMPSDVIVSKTVSETAEAVCKPVGMLETGDKILDLGPDSLSQIKPIITQAQTILWNGPLGVFELPPFASGTQTLARYIAESDAFSIAGGGDTVAAIHQFGISKQVSYISTGGGAFLEYVEGKTLPALMALASRA